MNKRKPIKNKINPTVADLSAHFKAQTAKGFADDKKAVGLYGGKSNDSIDEKELKLEDVKEKYTRGDKEGEDEIIRIQTD